MLDAELAQDFQLKKQYDKYWMRMTSPESQKEYKAKIDSIGSKYRIAVHTDQPLYEKFSNHLGLYKQLKTNPSMLDLAGSINIRAQFR